MLRTLFVLVGFVWSFSVSAITEHELIINLKSRMLRLPKASGSLIQSYTNHSQSYIYDQALAIIAFAKNGDRENARLLLQGLKSVQASDGSLFFSYYTNGRSPYPAEGDKRIAGAIAWVALSAIHYQKTFKSEEFLGFNEKILTYLQHEIQTFKLEGIEKRALRFAPSDIKTTSFSENEIAALEHNLDAYAAFKHFSELNRTNIWDKDINDLKSFILSLWDKKRSHFWSGVDMNKGSINKSELYLDNQTWSLLALDKETLKEISPLDALELNCSTFLVSHEGVNGFFDSKSVRRPSSYQFVWSEGTLGQALAMRKVGKDKCSEFSPDDITDSVKSMKKEDGGIAYATSSGNGDFTTDSSVAGTAWMFFAVKNINPFEIN